MVRRQLLIIVRLRSESLRSRQTTPGVPPSMTADILGVIPARFSSTRLPGKALVEIEGVPMVVRVWRQTARSQALRTMPRGRHSFPGKGAHATTG